MLALYPLMNREMRAAIARAKRITILKRAERIAEKNTNIARILANMVAAERLHLDTRKWLLPAETFALIEKVERA